MSHWEFDEKINTTQSVKYEATTSSCSDYLNCKRGNSSPGSVQKENKINLLEPHRVEKKVVEVFRVLLRFAKK